MYLADMEIFELCECDRCENERDNKTKTVGVGVEELLEFRKNKSEYCAEKERCDYLDGGLDQDGNEVDRVCLERLCYAKEDCENYKSYRVVKSDDGEQEVGKRALCLILTYYHQGCRGSGCRCDSRENENCGDR